MAVISMFYGIIISMYYLDNRQHISRTCEISGTEAVLAIPSGQLLGGELKANKMKLVQAWIEIHQEELMADWDLAINGQNVFGIDPLK